MCIIPYSSPMKYHRLRKLIVLNTKYIFILFFGTQYQSKYKVRILIVHTKYKKKSVLKIFSNFTEKHMCWGLFLIKLPTQHLFRRTSVNDCFYICTALQQHITSPLSNYFNPIDYCGTRNGQFLQGQCYKHFYEHFQLSQTNRIS